MPTRTPQQQSTRQAAIVSRAMLVCFKELRAAYPSRDGTVGQMFQDIFVAMAVRLSNERTKAPSSVLGLSRLTHLPRSNVGRSIKRLLGRGIIRQQGAGYAGDGAFLVAGIDRRHLSRIVGAIVGAAHELQSVQKNA